MPYANTTAEPVAFAGKRQALLFAVSLFPECQTPKEVLQLWRPAEPQTRPRFSYFKDLKQWFSFSFFSRQAALRLPSSQSPAVARSRSWAITCKNTEQIPERDGQESGTQKRAMLLPTYPFGYAVLAVSFAWRTGWKIMMQQMAPASKGSYKRANSAFRNVVGEDIDFPIEAGRYHLYVGWGCPWAHRTLLARALKGLHDVISVSFVAPSDYGLWAFIEEADPVNGCQDLRQVYRLASPNYSGKSTVPVLFDKRSGQIVNNESADIVHMLNTAFNTLATNSSLDLYPPHLRHEIDSLNDLIYDNVNNGVYKCGFAQTQAAFDEAHDALFDALDTLDARLATSRFLFGDTITESDVRLFPTLIRFDAAYATLFKCNKKRIADYPNLFEYTKDVYQLPGVAATCNVDRVKQEYFGTLFPLNPSGIVPPGPLVDFTSPSTRQQRFTQ